MARKQPQQEAYDLNPLKPTAGQPEPQPTPGDNSDLDEGRIISAGVGITEGELTALDQLAEQVEVSRNALMHLAVRLFLERVRAGEVELNQYFEEPERPKKRLKFRQQAKGK